MPSSTMRAATRVASSCRQRTASRNVTTHVRTLKMPHGSQPVRRPHYIAFTARAFSTSPRQQKGLMPDTSDPTPPQPEPHHAKNMSNVHPADLSESEYHELADQYLETLVSTVEEMVDKEAEKGLEVEYSAGVLTIAHPDKGTYVLNKQPPNKQIWLSSPVSGPKRFDWVLNPPAGQNSMDLKQDTEGHTGAMGDDGQLGGGKWTYMRDGVGLTEVLKDELHVEMLHEGVLEVGKQESPLGGAGEKAEMLG